ncbi:hypothetical protein NL676_021899 [Syzygium grande]|nr:hypothetical protein NL676_021899 [Syzygium grande]
MVTSPSIPISPRNRVMFTFLGMISSRHFLKNGTNGCKMFCSDKMLIALTNYQKDWADVGSLQVSIVAGDSCEGEEFRGSAVIHDQWPCE